MSTTRRLRRTRQCDKCPWKVSTDPNTIPDGYDEALHRALASTIAPPGDLTALMRGAPLRAMACHEHDSIHGVYCVGWLDNQLSQGNNIALRVAMMDCENLNDLQTVGVQHTRFEDTLPR